MVATSPVRGGRPDPYSSPRSWDTVLPPRRGQALWVTIGLLALPVGLLAVLLRVFPPRSDGPALLASFIPYGLVASAAAFAVLMVATVRARRRRGLALLAGLAAVLLAFQVGWLAPRFRADDRPVATDSFVVLSVNILNGQADPDQLVAAGQSADVVVLVESTPGAAQALVDRGWRERFGYVAGSPLEITGGSAIYSRFPLTNPTPLPRTAFQQWAVTAEVPGVGPVRVIGAHPCNPFCGGGRWAAEHDVLRETVAASADDLPLVVAGDLNAIEDHGSLQALHRAGLRTANDLAGAGWQPTFPANATVPPLIPIDHVLVDDQLTALSVTRVAIGGTDHLGLRAELAGTR